LTAGPFRHADHRRLAWLTALAINTLRTMAHE
jgi:hypothetical protein